MKKHYYTLIFLFFGFWAVAQTSSEVGVTEGQLSVSLSGAANYTIPIAVPPGINEIVPQISLAYNSQAGNGLAGYGWNISGISAISRIPSTKFHDGVIDPVNFNALDRFALDGQRLLVKSGTSGVYGANGTVYETESFSNIKITSFGIHSSGANYGPSYFIVEYPDGSRAFYGNSTDSRGVTDWSITYWENAQGVRISYTYSLTNNSSNITSIKYGSINNAAPINEIKFKYNNRIRPEHAYIGGLNIIRNTILGEINVIGNGVGFRNYILSHEETSLKYQRLIMITEKSGDNTKSYNPTVFNYDTTVSDIPLKASDPALLGASGTNYNNTDYISGDFDNDGRTDVVLYSKTVGLKNKYTLYSDIKSGKINIGKEDYVGNFENIFPATFLSSDNKILPQGWTILKKTDDKIILSTHGIGSTSATSRHYEKQFDFYKVVTNASNWSYCNPNEYNGLVTENVPLEYFSGDFNGDGLTDVIAIEKSFSYQMKVCDFGTKTTQYQRPVYQGGSAYFFDLDRRVTSNKPDNIGSIAVSLNTNKIFVADFNGDGKSDLYILEKNFIKVYTLNKDNKLELLHQNTVEDPAIVLDRPILLGDYNGDGKIDFVIPNELNKDSWNFYFATGTNFKKLSTSIGTPYQIGKEGYYMITGEDGIARFPYGLIETTFVANDFNGDGKTDILCQHNVTVLRDGPLGKVGTPLETLLFLFENQNVTGEEIKFSWIASPLEVTGIGRNSIPIFTNHNQVNQNLEYSIIYDNMIKSFKSPKDNREDVLLKRITNGNGVKETITYKPLQQDPYEPIYTPTSLNETFPNIDIEIAPSFKIVSMLEKQSTDVYKKQLYFYSGAVSNMEGLGFLGFRSTAKTNWHSGDDSGIIFSLSKYDISLRGANVENYTVLGLDTPLLPNPNAATVSRSIIKENYSVSDTESLVATQSIVLKPDTWIKPNSGSTFIAKIDDEANTGTSINTPSNFITKSLLTYESELLPNKVFKIKNSKTKYFNGLDDTSSETSVEYDDYNYPLKSTTYLKEAGAVVQTTISNVNYNPPTASPYTAGRPSGKTQSVAISGDKMDSEELYFYQNNLLTQIKKKGTNTDFIVEDNVYDSFGNITKKTITAAGLPPRITSYGYEPSGRFLTSSKDIEGLSTTFNYDLRNGLLKSETNPYGLTTSYLYDSWFKKKTTTDYLGKKNSYSYARYGAKTIVTATADDGSVTEETFDDLGRKLKTGSKNINGAFAYVDYLYDIQDRNYKVSEPYFGSSGTQWNETIYDDYGRVKQNNAFTGKITTIKYDGLSTTVNDGTKSKIAVKNAMGNIVSMTDNPGGTIKYTYFANGNLKESDFAGVKTTIKQDGWGRKTELKDSSAGTYTYGYNAFGETTSETTPNGTTTYILDDVGKLYRKTIKGINTESETVYFYEFNSKLLSNVQLTDIANGSQRTLTTIVYDDSKRISKNEEATPYATFTKEFKYDDFGRVLTETSTAKAAGKLSSKTIKNTYKNGSHWQILDNNTGGILWQTNTVTAKGELKNAQNGPLTITNEYDSYGLVSQFKYDKTSGGTNILTLNTVFDAKKGNLKSRENSLFSRKESFEYDDQDRLIEFTNAQGIKENQSYDNQGRITANSLGTYSYSKEKPYQNASITVTPEALLYYTAKPTQIIEYNAFKSPVLIDEKDIDKISFEYNDTNGRSTMFYGGLQDKKLERPLRKYYAVDGSMEVKENRATGVLEFITFIGGDAYTAPVVLRSNGTTQDYLYLQRDYQGSIVAITNELGNVVEKRLFDAWGAIVSVQDGAGNILAGLTVLDRGYTGHEHLQSVGLINMNGRIYDPKLHRFLQPDNYVQDPFNTQNYNRYGYCWNNPTKFTDPSGEWFWMAFAVGAIVGAVSGGASYATQAIQTGNWNWGHFGLSVLGGAVIGGVSGGYASMACTVTSSAVVNAFASGLIAGMMPVYSVQLGDWSLNVSPAVAFGTGGGPIGVAGSVGYNDGRKWSFSVNVTARVSAYTLGGGFSYSDSKNVYSAGFTHFGGKDEQNNWMVGYSNGDFNFKMTNDAFVGGDKARSAAAEVGIGRYSYGFNLYTTSPPENEYNSKEPNRKGGNEDYVSPIWGSSSTNKKNQGKSFFTYTSGARVFAGMYVGVKNGNHVQRLGYDGPEVQDLFQNGIHKKVVKGPYFNTNLGSLPSLFQQNFTYNPWTLYSN